MINIITNHACENSEIYNHHNHDYDDNEIIMALLFEGRGD